MQLIQPVRYRPSLVVAFVVLGLLIATASNTTMHAEAESSDRSSELAAIVEEMESERVALTDEVAELRDELAVLERSAAQEAGEQESFNAEVSLTRERAGLTPVSGPGLTVTLDDANLVPAGEDPNRYIIHDTDVAAVVNALLAGGAEAVDVNGQRIVATTAIRCAGTTILVNQTRLGAPYVVSAIGDAPLLEEALRKDLVTGELLGSYGLQYGLEVRLEKRTDVTVPAYTGGFSPRYAAPAEGSEG